MVNNINKKVRELYNSKDYPNAIETLYTLGPDKFIDLCEKSQWFINHGFLIELTKNQPVFTDLFLCDNSDRLLHQYFNGNNNSLIEFENLVAFQFPNEFISAIRVNQVFLKDNKEYLSSFNFPLEYKAHQKVWTFMRLQENKLWSSINENLDCLASFNITDVLCEVIIWLENYRFDMKQESTALLPKVYSFFINLYLQKFPPKSLVSSDSLDNLLLEKIITKKTVKSEISNLLNSIDQWLSFNDEIISLYCFDLQVQVKDDNGTFYLYQSPESYYKWNLDGARYGLNRFNYSTDSNEIIEYRLSNNMLEIPKGSSKSDEAIDFELEIKRTQLSLFLDDLAIDTLNISNTNISGVKLFYHLLAYATHQFHRYEKSLINYKLKSRNWSESFIHMTKDNVRKGLEVKPYFLMSETQYIELNKIATSELPPEVTNEIISLFSHNVKSKPNFNRFNRYYDVWDKPFIKLGEMLFCPMMFFANNDWFYAAAQVGIKNLDNNRNIAERTRTASLMENNLGQLFKEKKWSVKVLNNKDANEINGDVDVIVEDSTSVLFIQLKRTYFRLNLKDVHYESINTDRKAATQLNDAEVFFNSKNEIYNLKIKPVKWILTTSYEKVLTSIDGCLKVNYFDLLFALRNLEFKYLEELIEYVVNDQNLLNFHDYLVNPYSDDDLKASIHEAGLPLDLVEPQNKYCIPLFSENENSLEYIKIFNASLELDKSGKFDEAAKLLEVCKIQSPYDVQIYGALGNIYANLKRYVDSFKEFEKALSIIPNDPFITLNYAKALLENQKHFEALQILLKLAKLYPFTGHLTLEIENLYEKYIGKLTPAQIELINRME